MSLQQCALALQPALTAHVQRAVLRYMVQRGVVQGHVPGADFWHCLALARVLRVDLVLCLLRLEQHALLALLGHVVHHCPPCVGRCRPPQPPRGAPAAAQGRTSAADSRRVLRFAPPTQARENGQRRFLHTAIYQRMALIQPGLTVQQLLARGVRRDDIRCALRRGYVELSA